MRNILNTGFAFILLAFFSCKKNTEYTLGSTDQLSAINTLNSKAHKKFSDSVQFIVDKYIAKGIPGIQVTVKNANSVLPFAGGFSSSEKRTPMNALQTNWIFSITKTFTAVLIMKEVEKSKIDLDKTIKNYLNRRDADSIKGSNKITVRMLLNHTSGIIDFTALPEFIEAQFAHPLRQPSVTQKLKLIYNQPLNFTPGSDFSYSNSNYLLLHIILENVTAKTYESLLEKEIINPLHLNNTYYDLSVNVVRQLNFPNYYFDPNANGELANATTWNSALGNTSLGYGGIAAKPIDIIKFYENLVGGNVVCHKSFKEMTKWIQGKESTQPDYGLGIEYYQFAEGTTPQIGHEGDGIGCTTQIMYVPDTNTYLYINCTAGRKLPGPFLYITTDFKNELCAFVAKWRE